MFSMCNFKASSGKLSRYLKKNTKRHQEKSKTGKRKETDSVLIEDDDCMCSGSENPHIR